MYYVQPNDLKALLMKGPVSIAVDSSCLQNYSSGVITNPATATGSYNHAVLAVGYGKMASGTEYFTSKNSYGTTWGNGGYFKIGMIYQKDSTDYAGIYGICSSMMYIAQPYL